MQYKKMVLICVLGMIYEDDRNLFVRKGGGSQKRLGNTDVNCFLAKQQLPFRSNYESSISSNRGNYVELLHTLAAEYERLTRHSETSTVFSGFSNVIQNNFKWSNR